MPKAKAHPYHYWEDKNFVQRLVDIALPAGVFWLFFQFYNFGKITPPEMIKTSGLMAIAMLGITLIIGPLARIFPSLDFLKAHRKFWGILSFLIALAHTVLVFIFYYKFNLYRFVDFANSKYSGVLSGLLALALLLIITLTSNNKALTKLNPKTWKLIQNASYIAMILAIAHFYLMETTNGVLVIKRLLGRITLIFAVAVVVIRVTIMFLPQKRR